MSGNLSGELSDYLIKGDLNMNGYSIINANNAKDIEIVQNSDLVTKGQV